MRLYSCASPVPGNAIGWLSIGPRALPPRQQRHFDPKELTNKFGETPVHNANRHPDCLLATPYCNAAPPLVAPFAASVCLDASAGPYPTPNTDFLGAVWHVPPGGMVASRKPGGLWWRISFPCDRPPSVALRERPCTPHPCQLPPSPALGPGSWIID